MNNLKACLIVFVSLVLAACGSNQTKDEGAGEVQEPTVVSTALDDSSVESEDYGSAQYVNGFAAGVDTVFYFEFDSANLSAASQAALDAHAAALRSTGKSIRVEGHADERGSRDYNLALGERRAKKVADYLAYQGVSRSLMEVVSYGEEKPVALGSSERDYSVNRRVELR